MAKETKKDNKAMRFWDLMKAPPPIALQKITGGRMNGKSSIDPLWRIQIMTEVFGPYGIGWRHEIEKLWVEDVAKEQKIAFAQIKLYYKDGENWSFPIPGVGGSMLIVSEKAGLHSSDEAYKMAITDALSVSMKMIGVAADIYMGKWDGDKYNYTDDSGKLLPAKPDDDQQEILEQIKEKLEKETGRNVDVKLMAAAILVKAGRYPSKAANVKEWTKWVVEETPINEWSTEKPVPPTIEAAFLDFEALNTTYIAEKNGTVKFDKQKFIAAVNKMDITGLTTKEIAEAINPEDVAVEIKE